MKKGIKLLTLSCCENLLTFPTNPVLRQNYNSSEIDVSLLEYLKIPTKYLIEDELKFGTNSKDDCQSSIEIFKQLSTLDKVQANDKRLWVCLTHAHYFDYTKERWDVGESSSDQKIRDRFHFEGVGIDSRMGNAMSRLWWTAKVTVDNNRSDEFELTRLIWEKQDIQVALMERSFSTYPNVVQGFLEFYKSNKHLKEDHLRAILRGLNAIGGVKVLPVLSKIEIIDEIKRITDFSKIAIA